MKLTKKALSTTNLLLLLTSFGYSAIYWSDTAEINSTSWTTHSGTTTLIADPTYQRDNAALPGPFEGISSEFTATFVDGVTGVSSPAVGQVQFSFSNNNFEFRNRAGALDAGDMLIFNFDFNTILRSGMKINADPSVNQLATTSASVFKIGANTVTNTDLLSVAFTGNLPGNTIDTLVPAGISLPTTSIVGDVDPLTPATNLDFNDFTSGNAILTGVTGTDTLNFQSDGTNNIRVNLTDVQRSSADFSFDNVEYKFTAGEGGFVNNQRFRFTFEGIGSAPVPEPSSSALLGLGALGLLARRKR